MSATRITNKFLIKGMLNSCTSLNRLNLSRTRLSNRGVRHLRLPSLSSLNLDWTRVTSDCQVLLTGTPLFVCLFVCLLFVCLLFVVCCLFVCLFVCCNTVTSLYTIIHDEEKQSWYRSPVGRN